jgi:NADH:ubiquinone oxidoreductase subunit C
MNTEQLSIEIESLNNLLSPTLNNLVICTHISSDGTLTFTVYRQATLELATYVKLSSIFKANSPIDCHVVDRIEDKFRFTVTYNIQSFNNNNRLQIVTKTNDLLPLVSLQGVYPAFN